MSVWRLLIGMITLVALVTTSGCAWVRSLRSEISDEVSDEISTTDLDFYRDPANRFAPPPPASVLDGRIAPIAGTPLDMSGTRAKNLRISAADFIAANSKNENSLWNAEGQNNFLFSQNKLKVPGDLVTVVIEDRLRTDMVNSVRKLLPPEYRDADIRVPGLTKTEAKKDARAPATEGETVSDGPSYEDMMTAEVIERFPNGNLRLRGVKRIPFKRNVRNLEVVAIVKPSAIDEQDRVKSSSFFEHRVELYR